jgi:CBS domain-containing protein
LIRVQACTSARAAEESQWTSRGFMHPERESSQSRFGPSLALFLSWFDVHPINIFDPKAMAMSVKPEIPTAGDLMIRKVHTVSPEMSLDELIDFLLKHKISSAPVVETRDGKEFLVGFVSECDALEHLSNEMFYGLPVPKQTVKTCMKRHPIVITEDVDVFAISSLLVAHGYRHVPVVGEDNVLTGIVSRRDVLKPMQTYYADAIKTHDAEYFPPDVTKIINHRFIVSR